MERETNPSSTESPTPEVIVELSPASFAVTVALRGEHDIANEPGDRPRASAALRARPRRLFRLQVHRLHSYPHAGSQEPELRREGDSLEFVVSPGSRMVRRVFDVISIGDLMTVHEEQPNSLAGPGAAPELN